MRGLVVEKFQGENFLSFADRFKSLMILDNALYENMLNGAESKDKEIDDDDFSDEEAIALSKRLKHILLLHCEKSIDPVLQQHTTEHGLELWRRLHQRFNQRSRMTSMGRLVSIMSVIFELSTLENQMVLWEQEISKYETETASLLPDSIKIAVLIKGTSGNLQEWIQLNGSNMNVYADVRNMIVNYVRSKKTFSTSPLSPSTPTLPKSTPTPMEIDAVWKQIKGKSKGKGKFKGNSKGPEEVSTNDDSKPTCDHCGGTHKSRNCWYKPQSTSSSSTEYVDEHGNKWTMSNQTSNNHWNGSKGKGKGINSTTGSTPAATTPSISTVTQPPPGLSENKPKTQFIWGILPAHLLPEREEAEPDGLPGDKTQNLHEHIEQNLHRVVYDIEKLKSMIDILNTQVQNNIVEMRDFKEFYKKNQKHAIYTSENLAAKVDNIIGIYNSISHSKLMDLLDQKFEDLQHKFEPLLREPKISNNLQIYDMDAAGSMPSQNPTASTSSSTPMTSTSPSTNAAHNDFLCVDTSIR